MRVLHLDEQRRWGGGEQQLFWLVRALRQRGVWNGLVCRSGSVVAARAETWDFDCSRSWPLRGEWDLVSAWGLARLARTETVDIVHAHTGHAVTIAALGRRFGGRYRVVAHRRVVFPIRQHLLNRWKYARPDAWIAISEAVHQSLRAAKVPESRIALVPSAIDAERVAVEPMPRAALGIPPDAPLLAAVGSFVPAKGYDTLLDAFAHVLPSCPDARLCIAGNGPLRDEMAARASALGIASQVHFLGFVPNPVGLVKAADVLVSASVSEGLGTAIMEAMAAGTPTVATAAGGVPSLVKDCRTGSLVEVGNRDALASAILDVLRDRARAAAMAEAAGRLVRERHSVEAMAEGTLQVYERVLRSTP